MIFPTDTQSLIMFYITQRVSDDESVFEVSSETYEEEEDENSPNLFAGKSMTGTAKQTCVFSIIPIWHNDLSVGLLNC